MQSPHFVHQGSEYVRVSTVLSHLSDYAGIDPDVLARKSQIGTDVHKSIDAFLVGEVEPCQPEGQGYFSSFIAWHRAIKPEVRQTETRYFNDAYRLTGCLDALLDIGPDQSVLVDWKTSAQENAAVWPMQAHLYYYLAREAGQFVADRFLFVKLDKYGGLPKVFEYPFSQRILDNALDLVNEYWKAHPESCNNAATQIAGLGHS